MNGIRELSPSLTGRHTSSREPQSESCVPARLDVPQCYLDHFLLPGGDCHAPCCPGVTVTLAFPFTVQLEREAEVQEESRDVCIPHFTPDRRAQNHVIH